MADNVIFQISDAATPPDGTIVSSEEVTTLNGVSVDPQQLQRIILAFRTANATAVDITPGQASRASSFAVTLSTEDAALLQSLLTALQGTVVIGDGGGSVTIDDGSGSLTIDGSVGIIGSVAVTDNSGSLTVDGTVAATQSGTWDVGTLTSVTNVVHVDDNSSTLSVDDGAGSLTVDGTVTVQDGGGAISVDDNGSSLTVDGTVGATQSGTWTVQPGNTANTTAWKVDASSVAVPITDNSSSLTVDDGGGSLTVDGSLTAIATITNVVHVDDNSSTLSVDDGAGSLTVDGTVAASNLPSTVDTNSGNKSASTLRVVLATDQPTMSNAQPVTPAATEVHLGQVGGTTALATGTMTRPSDTNGYIAGDGVTTATSSASAMSVTGAARVSGGTGLILGGRASKSTTGTSAASFRIWIYQGTPTAIPNDNAAFTAAVHADYQVLVGTAAFDFANGIVGSDGVEVPIQLDRSPMAFDLASGTSLTVIWEARASYSPGSGEIFRLALDIVQD